MGNIRRGENVRKVLITGVSGFVGSYLANELLTLHNDEVWGMYRKRTTGEVPENIRKRVPPGPRFHSVEGDMSDYETLSTIIADINPDVIFHLAAQAYVPRSMSNPDETFRTNVKGTHNLLEAARNYANNPVIVFAGSSEEYGKVMLDAKPSELPINEDNPLRPQSPYAVSKVAGDFMMRSYHDVYGMKTVVSRAFNHEGPGRGRMYVTTAICDQVVRGGAISLGNVRAFRDWSHVRDIVRGYIILSHLGKFGEIYVQGSGRTNSVLTYALLAFNRFYKKEINEISCGDLTIENPLEVDEGEWEFGNRLLMLNNVDYSILADTSETGKPCKGIFGFNDGSIAIKMEDGVKRHIFFDADKWRPVDVPILFSDPSKMMELGFEVHYELEDIVTEQVYHAQTQPA